MRSYTVPTSASRKKGGTAFGGKTGGRTERKDSEEEGGERMENFVFSISGFEPLKDLKVFWIQMRGKAQCERNYQSTHWKK